MKNLLIVALLLLNLKGFSQESDDIVICNNVKIYQIKSGKFLTSCYCSEKNIIESFGVPDSIIVQDIPNQEIYKSLYYGPDCFTPGNSDFGRNISIKSDQFKLIVNDSIEMRVNNSIEKALKYFPKAVYRIQQPKKGVSNLVLYNAYSKSQAMEKDKLYYTSVLIIEYSPISKKISMIRFIDRD